MPLGQKALHVHSVQCCKQEYEVRYIRIYFVELSYSFMPGKIQNPSLLGKLLLSLPVLSAKLGIYKSYKYMTYIFLTLQIRLVKIITLLKDSN